jgi:hypothetical protein
MWLTELEFYENKIKRLSEMNLFNYKSESREKNNYLINCIFFEIELLPAFKV